MNPKGMPPLPPSPLAPRLDPKKIEILSPLAPPTLEEERRLKRYSDGVRRATETARAAQESFSESHSETTQLAAAMMIQFANAEKASKEQNDRIANLEKHMANVATQNTAQTTTLNNVALETSVQSSTLEKFRRTPAFTVAATFIATVIVKLFEYLTQHPPHLP